MFHTFVTSSEQFRPLFLLTETRKIQMFINPSLFIIERFLSIPRWLFPQRQRGKRLLGGAGLNGPPDSVLTVFEILTDTKAF